jgi:hypothetical protein
MLNILLFVLQVGCCGGKIFRWFRVQGSKVLLNGPCRQYLPKIAKPDISLGVKWFFKRDKVKKLFYDCP